MTIVGIARRLRTEESGFAMIVAVVLLGIMGTLMALMLSVSTHTTFSTARGKSWVQALHVAEAGAHRAVSKLQETNGGYTGTLTGETSEGTYSVTVTKQPRNRFRMDAVGTVPGGPGLGAARRLRVTMAPPRSFLYAMFSATSVETKANDVINGDVWGNQNVQLEQGTVVDGDVTAATGWIRIKNGARVKGDAWSGSFDPNNLDRAIHLENNAVLEGNAKASVTAPPDPVTCGGEDPTKYKVRVDENSTIQGNVTSWGPKTGPGTVQGTVTQNVCTASPPTKDLPAFTYSAANYGTHHHEFGTPSTASLTAVTDFQNHMATEATALSGSFYINQAGPVNQGVRINLTGVTVVGDLTIIANVPIFANGMTDSTSDAIVTLVSTYQPPTGSNCDINDDNSECVVHLKNNFQTSGNTAAVIYAPYGPVAIKNNQVQFGTIYSQNIQIKNNQSFTYDSRVERMVGFGPVTYEVETWLELAP